MTVSRVAIQKEDELKQFVMQHMAKHKSPKYVAFVDRCLMNAVGKILEYKIRGHAVTVLGLCNVGKIVTA